ncbi:hypothetical protein L916_17554, partial [Phytophthora nicotianae]
MIRSKLAFGYLAVMTSLTGTVSIDWTFLKDDSGSTSSPSSLDMDKKTSSTTERAGPSGPSLLDTPSALDLVSGSSSFDSETLLEKYATPSTAVSTVRSTYRNWVGPWSISSDTSCYREAHIMDVCPSNFDRNELTNTCWTECPLEFPLECGMECARQNTDCGLEVASKVSALAMAVLGTATFGVI